MATNPLLKKMLDAGMQFTEMSQKQAEKLVKEFVKAGHARKKDSDEMVREIVDRGRNLSEKIVAAVQAELAKQMGNFAGRLDELEGRVEGLAVKVGLASKAPAEKPASPAAEAAPTKTPEKVAVKPAEKTDEKPTESTDTGAPAAEADSQSD